MNPIVVHVVVVHVPVVGLLFAALTALAAAVWDDRRLMILALAFTALCAIAGVVAYGSGPAAYERLRAGLEPADIAMADGHAILGKISFAALVLLGVGVLQTALRWSGGTPPPRWASWALTAVLFLAAALLAYTAHLGGGIRHPEVRANPATRDPG
jgi:uncharacterized membrane protein